MSDRSFDTIIMDNNHDPKNVDGEPLAVYPEYSLKILINCQKNCHFTINVLIDIKFSSCYA